MTPPNKPKTPGEAAQAKALELRNLHGLLTIEHFDDIAAAAISAEREGEDWRSAAERAALAIDPYPELDVAHDALTRALEGGAQRADPTEAERAHCEREVGALWALGGVLEEAHWVELLLRGRAAVRAEGNAQDEYAKGHRAGYAAGSQAQMNEPCDHPRHSCEEVSCRAPIEKRLTAELAYLRKRYGALSEAAQAYLDAVSPEFPAEDEFAALRAVIEAKP